MREKIMFQGISAFAFLAACAAPDQAEHEADEVAVERATVTAVGRLSAGGCSAAYLGGRLAITAWHCVAGRHNVVFSLAADNGQMWHANGTPRAAGNDVAWLDLDRAAPAGSRALRLGRLPADGTAVSIAGKRGELGTFSVSTLEQAITVTSPTGEFEVVPGRTREVVSGSSVCRGDSGSVAIQNGAVVGVVIASTNPCGAGPALIAL